MDPISIVITLMIFAVLAGAMYYAYIKFVVQGKLLETTPTEPTEPTASLSTPGEVAGGVPGVDNMKGRPGSASVLTSTGISPASTINYYGGGQKLVPDGDAKTADVCHTYAKSMDINNWGWDRKNKSCFAYIDSSILTAMGETEANKVEGTSDYIVGCTESGVKILDGCLDLTKGNLVRGERSDGGYTYGTGSKVMTVEACRAYANENGYDAFAYRTNRNGSINAYGSCLFYNDAELSLKGYMGNNADLAHVSFCTDPSKKIIDGCQ